MADETNLMATSIVKDNEIVKATDFNFAFENLSQNIAAFSRMIFDNNKDFVIGGKVVPYTGLNVQIQPVFGISSSTGEMFGNASVTPSTSGSIAFESSTKGRIDIIECKADWEEYDEQQRAFSDLDTQVVTYEYTNTKKKLGVSVVVKQGTEGAAPEKDDGYVKLAEVHIRANASEIAESDIYNITTDIAGGENTDWTTEKTATYNIGYMSALNERFRVKHNSDGTLKDSAVKSNNVDFGTATTQVNGSKIPTGSEIVLPEQTKAASESVTTVLNSIAAVIVGMYNKYLKYGDYSFNGEVNISDLISDGSLVKPFTIKAVGDGTVQLKIDGTTILTIDKTKFLVGDDYSATSTNTKALVTREVTNAIETTIGKIQDQIKELIKKTNNAAYVNRTISTERFTQDSTSIYAATTENIDLTGLQTIDGVSIPAGVYVIVKNQTDETENGIYISSNTNWSRDTFNVPSTLVGKMWTVKNGSQAGKILYVPEDTFEESFGSDKIEFAEYFASVKPLVNKVILRDSSGNAYTNTLYGNHNGSGSGSYTGTFSGTINATILNGYTVPTSNAAIEKEVGYAAGNIPEIGTALSNVANAPIVNNGSGQLVEHSSGALGSAAFKNMATELSTSAATVLPNSVITSNFNCYVNSDANSTTRNPERNITISGVSSLVSGTYVKVLFKKDCYVSSTTYAATPKLNGYPIYTNVGGTPTALPYHQIVSGKTAGYWYWQAYTTMELVFMDSYWLIIGNPTLLSYYSSTVSFEVKADGKITIYAKLTNVTTATKTLYTFPVVFTVAPFIASAEYATYNYTGAGHEYNWNTEPTTTSVYVSTTAGIKWLMIAGY